MPTGLPAARPRRQSLPLVRSGLERRHRRDVHLWRVVFQKVVEEGAQDLLAKIERGVAAEFQRAERTAVLNLLAVTPRPQHEEDLVVVGVPWLDRLVYSDVAVD